MTLRALMLLCLLPALLLSHPASCRRVPDERGVQVYKSQSLLTRIVSGISDSFSDALHFVGSLIPLRGIASLGVDLGFPGAEAVLDLLTPRDRSDDRTRDNSSGRGHSDYREEVSSLVGAAMGEQECLLRLACLSGKHLNQISRGAPTVALMLSAASGYLPEPVQSPYSALRDSLMYSDDCSKYKCKADVHDEM